MRAKPQFLIAALCLLPTLAAARTAVLIGIKQITGLETQWITVSKRDVSEPVTFREIIIPIGTGFWRLGERDRCDNIDLTDDGASVGVATDRYSDRWIVPIASRPHVPHGMSCEEAKSKAEQLRERQRRRAIAEGSSTHPDYRDGIECDWSGKPVVFVNSHLLSEYEQDDSECGVHPDAQINWHTLSLPDQKVFDLSHWFKGDLKNLFQIQFAKKFREDWQKDATDVNTDDFPANPDGWVAYHVEGRYGLRGMVPTHRLMGYFTDFDLPIEPPVELFGNPQSPKLWRQVKASFPTSLDAYFSPKHDIAIVVTGSRLGTGDAFTSKLVADGVLIVKMRKGKPSRQLYKIPLRVGSVIMVEWATGRDVPRWDYELRGWAEKGLPNPVIDPALSSTQ